MNGFWCYLKVLYKFINRVKIDLKSKKLSGQVREYEFYFVAEPNEFRPSHSC